MDIKKPPYYRGLHPHINRQVKPDYKTVIVEPISDPLIR